jgi:hypothetical protein
VVDRFAERAGQVRRVRHAPITAGGGGAGASAIFGPGAPDWGLARGDFGRDQGTPA